MTRWMISAVCLLTAALSWAQNQPAPQGEPITSLGFTESQAKVIQADLDQWNLFRQRSQADVEVLNAQEKRYLMDTPINRSAIEKVIQSRADSLAKRDLARLDLIIKWKDAYGADKEKLLEPRLQPPPPPGMNGPAGQPAPSGPAPGPAPGQNPAPGPGPSSN